jgi:hypothetical protein
MASGDISTLASTLHRYYGTVTPTATVPSNPMLGDMYVNKTTQEAYFYSGFGNFNGWSLLRNIVTVTVDPTVTSPSSGDNDIVMYNKTPYMKISGVWTAFAPDIAGMITTALIPVNTNITNNTSAITTLQGEVSTIGAKVSLFADYYSSNSPSISNTASLVTFDTKEYDPSNLYASGILTSTTLGNIEISGKLVFNLTATLAISVGTLINIMVYYRSSSADTWALKKTLRAYRVSTALVLNATLKDDIILPLCTLYNIPIGGQIAIYASQNTGGTLTVDNAAGSNWINFKVIPI